MPNPADHQELEQIRWRLERLVEQRRLSWLSEWQRYEYDLLVRREEELLRTLAAA